LAASAGAGALAFAGPNNRRVGFFVEIVHRAADIAQRPAPIGHQQTRALVEIFRQFADRFHRLEQLAALLAAGQRIQAEHEVVGLAHHAVDLQHDVIDLLGVARQRRGERLEVSQ